MSLYVVDGHRLEPLLGDRDEEDLGINYFNKEDRKATAEEKGRSQQVRLVIPAIRKAVYTVQTNKPLITGVRQRQKECMLVIEEKYKSSMFSDHIGNVNTKPIKLEYESKFRLIQPPRLPVPYHYQECLSRHLQKLLEEG